MLRTRLYILKMLAKSLVITSLVATAVACLVYSQRYLDEIVERSFPIVIFFEIIITLMPFLLVVAMPVTLCVSIVFIYNKLITDSEILVLRAAGVSQFGLATPAVWLALLATGFSYLMTLYFVPLSYERFKDIETMVRRGQVEISLPAQTFNTLERNLTAYYSHELEDGTMQSILVQDNRNAAEPITVIADSARVSPEDGEFRIYFWDGILQRFDREQNQTSSISFDQYILTLNVLSANGAGEERRLEPREMGLADLLEEQINPEIEPRQRNEATVEIYIRLVSPLLCLTIAMIAVTVMFVGEQVRTRFSKRVFAVGAVVAALLMLFQWLMGLTRGDPAFGPLLPVAAIVPGIVATIVLWLSNRRAPKPWRTRRLDLSSA
ncbi:MAG: LptF/LptG family permease [Pseudomonadota bacterium]